MLVLHTGFDCVRPLISCFPSLDTAACRHKARSSRSGGVTGLLAAASAKKEKDATKGRRQHGTGKALQNTKKKDPTRTVGQQTWKPTSAIMDQLDRQWIQPIYRSGPHCFSTQGFLSDSVHCVRASCRLRRGLPTVRKHVHQRLLGVCLVLYKKIGVCCTCQTWGFF